MLGVAIGSKDARGRVGRGWVSFGSAAPIFGGLEESADAYSETLEITCLAFPYNKNAPTRAPEFLRCASIAFDITTEFGEPVRTV